MFTTSDISNAYNFFIRNHNTEEDDAYRDDIDLADRSFFRNLLFQAFVKAIIELAWKNLGGKSSRLSFDKQPIPIPIRREYVERIKNPDVKAYILGNIGKYIYKFKTDVHAHIDGKLVFGVECKAYAENAMLKRIMVDFTFLKQAYPKASAVLLQLESQLGGDYSDTSKKIHYGSCPTHTIMSYFDVDLNIITLLEGERKVDKPIHKKEFYKELKISSVAQAVGVFEGLLKKVL